METLPQMHVARRTATKRSRPRMISCFARGIVTIVGRLIRGDGLVVVGRFVPEPWPTRPSVPKKKNTKSKAHVAQEGGLMKNLLVKGKPRPYYMTKRPTSRIKF